MNKTNQPRLRLISNLPHVQLIVNEREQRLCRQFHHFAENTLLLNITSISQLVCRQHD